MTPSTSSKRPSTITIGRLSDYFLYFRRRPLRERLLPLRTRSAPNARFKGITPKRPPWTECTLYEMPVFAPCPNCSLHVRRKPCHHYVGHPESGITPPSLHDTLTSARLLLHRYLRELPQPICCRGIIFGYVAVAPFLFRRRGTFFLPPWRQMLHNMLMLTFS